MAVTGLARFPLDDFIADSDGDFAQVAIAVRVAVRGDQDVARESPDSCL